MANEIRHPLSLGSLWIERLLCAALAALLLWKGILPAWHNLNTDFPNYYLVARLLREGYSLDRIYDWIWLQRIKDHWGLDQSLVGFAGLSPFSAPPIVPLSVFSALTAKRIWIVLNLLLLAASVELLHPLTSLGRRSIWMLALLAIVPLRTSFLYGQMHLCVLFLLVLAYYFHCRHRELACGACIALAAALKIYPLSFILYFLWKRQWRPALAILGTLALITFAGGFWMGWDLLHVYATQILPRSLQGEVLDPYNLHAESFAALLHRLFLFEPTLNPSPLFPSTLLYAVAYPLWQIAILVPLLALLSPPPTPLGREQGEWGAFLLALLVLSPVPSSYHFVVMILPVVLLVDSLLRRNQVQLALVATALYTLIATIDLVTGAASHLRPVAATLLGFSRLWLLVALFAVFLFSLWRYPSSQPPKPTALRTVLLAGFAVAVLAIGVSGYRHHFANGEREMSHRISTPSATYLATAPHPIPGTYLFVAMLPQGYRILDQQGREAAPRALTPAFTDQLSFAVAKDGSVLLEEASATGSRIIRAADGSVVAEDAESPTVSPDGGNLAFLRESKGRGALWITTLSLQPDTVRSPRNPPSSASVLDQEDYDVRNASFLHSGDLLLIARHDGRLGLFTIAPGSHPVPLLTGNDDIGYVAISPDEHRLALTELIHNRWQLLILDLRSRSQTILTFGDCNAYSPVWTDSTSMTYAPDCGRGLGLTALASIHTEAASGEIGRFRAPEKLHPGFGGHRMY